MFYGIYFFIFHIAETLIFCHFCMQNIPVGETFSITVENAAGIIRIRIFLVDYKEIQSSINLKLQTNSSKHQLLSREIWPLVTFYHNSTNILPLERVVFVGFLLSKLCTRCSLFTVCVYTWIKYMQKNHN